MKNLKKHWEKVNPGWRHVVKDIPKKKQDRLIYNYEEYFLKKLNLDQIKYTLDWGCGGGLLTKELKKISHTSAVDISEDSLEQCINYAKPDYTDLVPSNLNEFTWGGTDVDFILCHALVWHFSTLEYFKKVLRIWEKLSPKYIAFNTKPIKTGYKQTDNYNAHFLHALKISDDVIEKMLKEVGYKVNSKILVGTGVQPQTYYTFKRKN